MADPAGNLLTYPDLLAATRPDHPVPELVDGELRYKASPRATHSWSQGRLFSALGDGEGGEGDDPGWWILVEPDVVFSEERVLRPDLAGVRRVRLPELPDTALYLCPDWVCELLSPGREAYDREAKARLYAEEGVPFLWLVHPDEAYVEAFELRQGAWSRLGAWSRGTVRIPPFDLAIEVERLFARPAPRAEEPPPPAYGAARGG